MYDSSGIIHGRDCIEGSFREKGRLRLFAVGEFWVEIRRPEPVGFSSQLHPLMCFSFE